MNRGADRQDIFSDPGDFDTFEHLLGRAAEATAVAVHAYCLMTNHVHLVVAAPNGPSELMRRLLGGYAITYNQRHGRDGPLFRGRFTSVGVEADEQLPTLVRYVHRNPLDVVPTGALAAYRYSSYPVYLGRRPAPEWLRTDVAMTDVSPAAHRRFVETDLPHDTPSSRAWPPAAPAGLLEIVDAVAAISGESRGAIRSTDRTRRSDARTVAVMLAVELRAAGTSDIAACFEMSSASSVRSTARRGRVRSADDPAFARLRRDVLAVMRPGHSIGATAA